MSVLQYVLYVVAFLGWFYAIVFGRYPRGFRDQLPPAVEPRVGAAFDVFGNNTTKLHASAGVFHNAVLGGGSQGNLQGPPFFTQSTLFYNTLTDFMAPGATLERLY